MQYRDILETYVPACEQEQRDLALMRRCADLFDNLLTRDNELCHFTASSWIVSDKGNILMAWHNVYKSWAWTGGHADGEADALVRAISEAREETGITDVRPLSDAPISIEVLPVRPHRRRGRFVSGHLHLNVTCALCAPEDQVLRVKRDENSAVRWFSPEAAVEMSTEEEMHDIYRKLNARIFALTGR